MPQRAPFVTHFIGAIVGGLMGLVLAAAVGVFWLPASSTLGEVALVATAAGAVLGGLMPGRGVRFLTALFRIF